MSSAALSHHNATTSLAPMSIDPAAPATRLATLSPNHVAFLHTTSDGAAVHIASLSSTPTSSSLPPPIPVPEDAHMLLACDDLLAVIGTRSVTVIDHALSRAPKVHFIATSLFETRPGLTAVHAGWLPHAPAFLLLLTSDATLRLYDVLGVGDERERLRLRVITNDCSPPVSFTFGRSLHSWDALSVYVLARSGDLYVVSPVAPVGTRLPYTTWRRLRRAAADRKLSTAESWPARQAEMQLRFLDRVFERSAQGDMVAVREFKPAPLLFQGPLFIEHDDVSDLNAPDAEQDGSNGTDLQFSSVSLLNCGADVTPVLLRVCTRGTLSVLLAVEPVEAQWFLSSQSPTANSDNDPRPQQHQQQKQQQQQNVLAASEEYAACATQVAPSLLCFEHVSLRDAPLSIVPLGGATHADVVFLATPRAVYSLRLTFIAFLSDAAALERAPPSVLSRVLSAPALTTASPASRIIGLVPHYAQLSGPLALALTAGAKLHATPPLKWASQIDTSLLPPSTSPAASSSVPTPGAAARKRFACPDLAKDASHLLAATADAQRRAGGNLVPGTLGRAAHAAQSTPALAELERRVALYTGDATGSARGATDHLGDLSNVLSSWAASLAQRAADAQVAADAPLAADIASVTVDEARTRSTLARVAQVGALLDERMRTLVSVLHTARVELTPAEMARMRALRDRSKRLTFYRSRINELALAINAADTDHTSRRTTYSDFHSSPGVSERRATLTPGRMRPPPSPSPASSPFKNVAPARRLSFAGGVSCNDATTDQNGPLAKKRPQWADSWAEKAPLGPKDVARIRAALEKHSEDIANAMLLDSSLRKKLSVS